MNPIEQAYQLNGIRQFLRGLNYDCLEIESIINAYDGDVDKLRYRYNIDDSDLNLYWYRAHGIR